MYRRVALLIVPLAIVITMFIGGQASADVNDFVINDFSADYYLSRDDRQGRMKVEERIDLTFSDNNHGILRALPLTYKDASLDLAVESVRYGNGAAIPYSSYEQNGNLVLKIGDSDKIVTGQQTYLISYRYDNVITFYEKHDELYWDINGDQWQQPFERVTARFHLPPNASLQDGLTICYTGSFGSSAQSCTISFDGNVVTVQTDARLENNQSLTAVLGFSKGYFVPPSFRDRFAALLPHAIGFIAPVVLFGGYAARRWLRLGRDPKGRGTIVPQYEPPDGLKPAPVGVLADMRDEHRDITASLIDLAIRGFIRLIEHKIEKKLRKDTLEYTLELHKTDWSDLESYEQQLLSGIFGKDPEVNKQVELKDLKDKFYKDVAVAQKTINQLLVDQGYFRSRPAAAGGRLWVLLGGIFLSLFIAANFINAGAVIGLLVAGTIVLISALAMPARTLKGVHAKETALGLQLYIKTAESERIKMMQSPDAPYAIPAGPSRNVELFERLLPYAIVFGVEKQWAAEFKDIYMEPPAWFNGTGTAFSSVYLANAITCSVAPAMNNVFSAPSSSSSSGFGSGGFSGGGGGGGGGGGW